MCPFHIKGLYLLDESVIRGYEKKTNLKGQKSRQNAPLAVGKRFKDELLLG